MVGLKRSTNSRAPQNGQVSGCPIVVSSQFYHYPHPTHKGRFRTECQIFVLLCRTIYCGKIIAGNDFAARQQNVRVTRGRIEIADPLSKVLQSRFICHPACNILTRVRRLYYYCRCTLHALMATYWFQ